MPVSTFAGDFRCGAEPFLRLALRKPRQPAPETPPSFTGSAGFLLGLDPQPGLG